VSRKPNDQALRQQLEAANRQRLASGRHIGQQ